MTDAQRERGMIILFIVLAAIAVFLLTGCGSTQTKVVYEKVDVPRPFWSPPEDIKPEPEEPNYQAGHVTPEEAATDPTTALVVVGQDLDMCLGSNELMRHLYRELVKLIAEERPSPEAPPE